MFVESPVRAALIRTQILDDLMRLKSVCDRTIVIAHSQGAAVVLDALGGIVDSGADVQNDNNAPAERPVPDTLLTFGAGTNQLTSLKVLSAGLPEKIGSNPVIKSVLALVVAVASLAWLFWDVRAGQTTVPAVGEALGLFMGVIAASSVLVWAIERAIAVLARRWEAVQTRRVNVTVGIGTALMLSAMFAAIRYADRHDLPFGSVAFAVAPITVLLGSFLAILSRDLEEALNVVRMPPGLATWIDIYASGDPVPNGPTRIKVNPSPVATPTPTDTGTLAAPQAIPIWNLGSMLSDHTTYWSNLDGFVLRVARTCAETARVRDRRAAADEPLGGRTCRVACGSSRLAS